MAPEQVERDERRGRLDDVEPHGDPRSAEHGTCDEPPNPKELTEPGLLPGGATPHGVLENVLGSAVPAFIVTALLSGKAGVRDLARRSFRWRVPLRWYLISLLVPLLIFLITVTILYGLAPLRALAQNWLQLLTAFLPALVIMILLNNVAEEIG